MEHEVILDFLHWPGISLSDYKVYTSILINIKLFKHKEQLSGVSSAAKNEHDRGLIPSLSFRGEESVVYVKWHQRDHEIKYDHQHD